MSAARLSDWTLEYWGFDSDAEGVREALCTLGNGYLATRGAAPESTADSVHYPGTYAAGCYDRLSDTVGGQVVENESLVNLPNWLPFTFRAEDGPWLGQPGAEILDEHRVLDLRRGILTRRLRVRDSAGRTTRVVQRRFVHMRLPHLCGLQTVLAAENWSGTLMIRSWLDGSVRNNGVPRYRSLSATHLRVVQAELLPGGTALLVVETRQSHLRIAQAARTRVVREHRLVPVESEPIDGDGRIGQELRLPIAPGAEVTVDKLVTTFTSRDTGISDPATEAVTRLGWQDNFSVVLHAHELAWRQLWQRFRIDLRGRGAQALPVVRLHLFHVLQTVSPNSVDLDVGVPARGLHGEAYRGHVLWDELFVFSILNLRAPLLTRALLRYRYRRLPWARRAAREAGHVGAAYPWQSGSDGREESQRLHLNPVSGRWVADPTSRQRHIGLAVGYNVWQYYQATEDRDFLNQYGAEMILDIARYFADLATFDPDRQRYVIRGVMGPDEFHTGYPDRPDQGVDNNAYTNVMTVWLLCRALDVLRELPARRRAELVQTLGMRQDEPARWEDITRRMFVPVTADGVISQFEGYDQLAELPWDDYRGRYGDIRRLDRILEAEGDSPNRYQASKQADVLMLFYLLSAEELYELFAGLGLSLGPDAISRNVEYYVARTSHGSTLSAVVHAWVLARNHRERALEYFVEALSSDVTDVRGGTTAEGIHLAAMAGSIDILQRCFAGVETRGDTLWLNPYWPGRVGTMEFDIRYREHVLNLRISGRSIRVRAEPGARRPIQLRCGERTVWLGPGETIDFPGPVLPPG